MSPLRSPSASKGPSTVSVLRRRSASLPALAAGLLLAPAMLQAQDFSTLPPEPAEMEQQLSAAAITMPSAIAAAEKFAGVIVATALRTPTARGLDRGRIPSTDAGLAAGRP